MQTVTETPIAKRKIKSLGKWEKYLKQKKNFIENPNLSSLDVCLWDKKNRIFSFKITNKYRVKFIKNLDGSNVVFDAGDFHR